MAGCAYASELASINIIGMECRVWAAMVAMVAVKEVVVYGKGGAKGYGFRRLCRFICAWVFDCGIRSDGLKGLKWFVCKHEIDMLGLSSVT